MFNFNFCQTSSIDWTTIIASFTSAIIGALIAGAFSWLATKQAYNYNQKLEEKKELAKINATKNLIKESIIQVKKILTSTFQVIFSDKSKYGYFNKIHSASKYIFPLFDEAIKDIGIINDKEYQKIVIQIYTELKSFINSNESYSKCLLQLKAFRKENLNQDILWNRNLIDYFNIEEIILSEQSKEDSKISYEFFKYQQPIIDDLKRKSQLIVISYDALIERIEKFLELNKE